MFHYLFPPLTIGLGLLMVCTEGLYLKTGDKQYERITKFWTKIFAVNFAIGVATGIVMEFQFGTNWSRYSKYVGDVFGSALAAEGIFAFFLESGFLAILVFGWDRVSKKMHFFATCMVALGSIFSSVWIVIANSWQQTPAGSRIEELPDGSKRAVIEDFWQMVFNPSTVDRLIHVWLGAIILGAFFVLSITAYYLYKGRHLDFARKTFKVGLVVAAVASCAMMLSGHHNAKMVAENQPAKLAAFEGHFTTGDGPTGLYVMGWPDEKTGEVKFGIEIPYLLTFLVHEDFKTPVTGLDKFPKEDRPPVWIPFQAYHLMIGFGVTLLGLAFLGLFLWWRKKLFTMRWIFLLYIVAVIPAYLANQMGWVSAEVGRQPWVVYNQLRTEHAVSPSVPAWQVLGSILMFSVIYFLLFCVWVYVMNDKIKHGPEEAEHPEDAAKPKEGFLAAASATQDRGEHSLTEVTVDKEGTRIEAAPEKPVAPAAPPADPPKNPDGAPGA